MVFIIDPILHKILCKIPIIENDGKFHSGVCSEAHIEKMIRTAAEKTAPFVAGAVVSFIGFGVTKEILEKKKEKQM